jgi:hypothetical protein
VRGGGEADAAGFVREDHPQSRAHQQRDRGLVELEIIFKNNVGLLAV